MVRYKKVRLSEQPYWSQGSEFEAAPGKLEVYRDGQDVHLVFAQPRSGMSHVIVPWSACSYAVPEDEPPPEDETAKDETAKTKGAKK